MKLSNLKSLIKTTIKESLSQRNILKEFDENTFTTEVQIDYVALKRPHASEAERETYHKRMQKATGWWDGIIEDVEVIIDLEVSYEDNRFSYEYGSERGVWDPGSGKVAEGVKITALQDVYLYDKDGKPMQDKLVFKRGAEIPEDALTFMSQKRLNKEIDRHLRD